eukprot:COSAG02_NODE_275_length_26232_cov_85.210424_13_plen_339_part_00
MQQPMLQQQSVLVYGIPLQDPEAAKKVNRVIVFSAITAACSVLYYGLMFAETGSTQTIAQLLLALLVPACGYFGAKNKSQGLLCAFWGCNLLQCIGFVCIAIVLLMILSIFGLYIKILQPFSDCCQKLETCGFGADCTCTTPFDGASWYFASSTNDACIATAEDFHSTLSSSDAGCTCCSGTGPGGGFCTPTFQGPGSSKADCAAKYPAACSTCTSGGNGVCNFASSDVTASCGDSASSPCCIDESTCDEFSPLKSLVGGLSGNVIYALAIIPLCFAVPSCLACYFGYSLYNTPSYFVQMAAPLYAPGMVGAPIATQPAYGQQQPVYAAAPVQAKYAE